MHSAVKIGVALVLGGGLVGGIAYWEGGAFDRLCVRGAKESLSDQQWTDLTNEHIEDPKLLPVVSHELDEAAKAETCKDSFKRADDHVGQILTRQKTSDDVSLQAIAHMMTRCNEPKLATWTSRPVADIVKAIHAREIPNLVFAPPNVLPDLLLGLKPKVDQDLVDIVIASTKPAPSSVDGFWTNGFPPDGADFASGGAVVAPAIDPRQTHGIAQWLWSLQEPGAYGIQPEAATAILRMLDHVTPPKLDDKIVRCLGLANGKEPEAIKLCRHLAGPDDKDLIAKLPNDADRKGCLEPLPERDLARGVMDKDPKTRKDAEKALAIANRHAFAVAIAKSFQAGIANEKDVPEVQVLLTDPPVELEAWLSMLATGAPKTAASVSAFVKEKSKPEEWIPALFAGISPKTLQGATEMLMDTDGIGPIVGAILSHALSAAGSTDKVDPSLKQCALTALAAKGTAKDAPAIEPFTSDPTQGGLANKALLEVKGR